MFCFFTPENRQETEGFLMFSGGIEMKSLAKKGWFISC